MYKFFIILLSIFILTNNMNAQKKFTPPSTPKIPVSDTMHNFIFTDDYRWLEDKNDSKVKAWSHAQHDYTVEYLKQLPEIPKLKEEIRAYLERDVVGAPFFKGEREFYYAKKKGEQQSKLYTKYKGKEYIIFDPEKIDPTGKTSINGVDFTEDGNRAAVNYQFQGSEINKLMIIDTKTGKQLYPVIDDIYNFNWAKDEDYAYVTFRSKEMVDKQIPLKVYKHKIGDDHANNVLLITNKDAKNFGSVWDADEGDVTFFTEGDFWSNNIKIRDLKSDDAPKEIFSSKKYKATPFVKNGKIFIFTNDNAPNFKLMVTDIDKPEYTDWKEFYPEKETVLESAVPTKDNIIIQYKKDVLSRLAVYSYEGKFIKDLELPEVADVSSVSYHKESNTLYVSLNSFTAATKVYKTDAGKLEWEFFYQDNPPIETKNIESKMVFYPSKDGTKIPMFIMYKKGLELNGKNPTLLYGYGGFNVGISPSFLGMNAAFINRGGVFAIAGLRGGNEYGENWHQDGMMFKKQNTFDDFIAACEYLTNEKYTNKDNLVLRGGSNGGLLIGAMITQRPDLFKASVCAVPLLDMLRYQKFLIARYWIPEYGDPEKKDEFLNILKYSPYHNIKKGFNYPTTLVKAGENDSRVDALHAKKFAAALQNSGYQNNPIMLYIDFESGHGSGQSVEQSINNVELEWRFIMHYSGLK